MLSVWYIFHLGGLNLRKNNKKKVICSVQLQLIFRYRYRILSVRFEIKLSVFIVDEQERIQRKTFVNWINSYLGKRKPPMKVSPSANVNDLWCCSRMHLTNDIFVSIRPVMKVFRVFVPVRRVIRYLFDTFG